MEHLPLQDCDFALMDNLLSACDSARLPIHRLIPLPSFVIPCHGYILSPEACTRGADACLGGAPCSFMMEYDVHTLLDLLSLAATAWVIFMMRFRVTDSYQADQDTVKTYYVVRASSSPGL